MIELIHEKIQPILSFFEYEGHILGLDKEGFGIFEINETRKNIELKGVVPDAYGTKSTFSKVIPLENRLVFIPYNSEKIVIYYIAENKWVDIDIETKTKKMKFLDAMVNNNTLYMFPFNYECIVKIDLNTHIVTYINICELCSIEFNGKMVIKHINIDKENVLIPIFSTNIILKYNIIDDSLRKYEVVCQEFQINTITCDGEYIYLASRNSLEIIKLNFQLETIQRVKIQKDIRPIGDEFTYFDQSGFECYGDELYCFPARWNHVVKINRINGKVSVVSVLDDLSKTVHQSEKISKFNHGITVDNKIYIQNFDKKILVFNMKDETFQVISIEQNDPMNENVRNFIQYVLDN